MKKPYPYPGLRKQVQKLRKCAEQEMPALKQKSYLIIENTVTECYEIEKVLDRLLDMMLIMNCEEEFTRLNRYYSRISPEDSAFYQRLLDETFYECD